VSQQRVSAIENGSVAELSTLADYITDGTFSNIGLDLSLSVLARCLLGCSGTARHYPAPSGPPPSGPSSRNGTSRHHLIFSGRVYRIQEQTLNLRVRGSSPWRRTNDDLGFLRPQVILACSVLARIGHLRLSVDWSGPLPGTGLEQYRLTAVCIVAESDEYR
jgi:hypothetical protein